MDEQRNFLLRRLAVHLFNRVSVREIGMLLPNNQRQHHTVHLQKDVLPYALC